MSGRWRSVLGNLALLGASVVVVLAAAEGFLRLFPRFLPATARLKVHWAGLPAPIARPDSTIGWLLPVNAHEVDGSVGVRYEYSTDEFGFRNPSPWPDRTDVVVVGDSEAFGWGVPDDSTWSRSVCRQLAGVDLINLGVPGMAPKQYLRVYERFGVPLHPKLLLFGLFSGNDLQDERLFDSWLNAGSPGNFATWRFSEGERPGGLRRIVRRSFLYWFVRETADAERRRLSAKSISFKGGGRIQFAPSFLDAQSKLATPSNRVFGQVMHSIEDARALADRNGTAFLVLLFPTKEEVYLPLRGDSIPQVLPVFVRELEKRGIPYLDLRVPLQAAARRGERLFFEVDGHPNQHGYDVIAAAVAEQIRRHAEEYHLSAPR